MESARSCLQDRDWDAVAKEYVRSSPYNYAVVDDFLRPSVCTQLRRKLLEDWAWHYKSPYARELYLRNPDLSEAHDIAHALKCKLPRVVDETQLVEHWAFLHNENSGLVGHSDVGALSVDLWLTPNEYNNDSDTGGLILYDVKRPDHLSVFEFQTRSWTLEYLERETSGGARNVSYAYNRAVIFDARTLHSSDRMHFGVGQTETFRLNFSLLFEDPVKHRTRANQYAKRFAVMERLAVQKGLDPDRLDLRTAEWLWSESAD